MQINVEAPLEKVQLGQEHLMLRLRVVDFAARITGEEEGGFGFIEQQNADGEPEDMPGGREGVAINLAGADVPVDKIVKIFQWQGEYAFVWEGVGGSITVQEQDGTPIYTGIGTIIVDQEDGFVMSQPAAGQARIDQTPASASTVGYTTLAGQYLGAGQKTVDALGLALTPGSMENSIRLENVAEIDPSFDLAARVTDETSTGTYGIEVAYIYFGHQKALPYTLDGGNWRITQFNTSSYYWNLQYNETDGSNVHVAWHDAITVQFNSGAALDIVSGYDLHLTIHGTLHVKAIVSDDPIGATLADGDYTGVEVSGSGTVITVKDGTITLAKMNASAGHTGTI